MLPTFSFTADVGVNKTDVMLPTFSFTTYVEVNKNDVICYQPSNLLQMQM